MSSSPWKDDPWLTAIEEELDLGGEQRPHVRRALTAMARKIAWLERRIEMLENASHDANPNETRT